MLQSGFTKGEMLAIESENVQQRYVLRGSGFEFWPILQQIIVHFATISYFSFESNDNYQKL